MNKSGPIIIIEDDIDDQEIITVIFSRLGYPNELRFFGNGEQALEYLIETKDKPFIIISDINMPKLNGIELRQKMLNNERLRMLCIPYLLLTTATSQKWVVDAYSQSIQGFFVKPTSAEAFEEMLKQIIGYWTICTSPNYIP